MKLRFTLNLLQSLLLIAIVSLSAVVLLGVNGWLVAGVLFFMSAVAPLLGFQLPAGSLLAGVYAEIWTREIVKRFNKANLNSFLSGIRDLGSKATLLEDGEVAVINLTYFGVSPTVLIDNITYPIAIQALDGIPQAIQLRKFQTLATPVTDDEIMGLSYDKIAVVQEAHAIKIIEEKNALAIHSIAPNGNTAKTPVMVTTGPDDGTGRKRLLRADIVTYRKAWIDAGFPIEGTRLVLCSDHVTDLLLTDQAFQNQYYNFETGTIGRMFGFENYEGPVNPYYNATTKAKLSYGGVVTSAHTQASVVFNMQRVVRAQAFTKAYLSPASSDPQNQRNLLNYRTYDIVTPLASEGVGAIISGKV